MKPAFLSRYSLFVLMALLVSFCAALPAAAATTYTVVTPSNSDSWQTANVRTDATVGITTAQPRGTAPNNLGSLQFTTNTVTSGQDKADYVKYWGVVPGRTLGNISELSYDFFRASSSTTAQHFVPAFRLAYQTSGGQTGYLIWENVYNGGSTTTPVPTDQWISNNILNGYFWMRAYGPSRTIEKYDVTLAQWASGYTSGSSQPLDANTNIVGIEVGVGSGWGGTFTGYVDQIAASFGSDSVTANFEPNPVVVQCTTTCYVNGTNGSDTNGGTSPGDAKKTIQAAVNQVSPNGTVIVAAGTYNETVTINKDGLDIKGAGKTSTIIQGSNCTTNGITLVGSRNGLTVEDLSVTGFENGIYLGVGSDTQTNITIEDVDASANCRHGIISQDGVITNLSINRVTASNNGFPNSNQTGSPGRGIWIINGIKTNISVTNSTVSNNFISGIDLGDGNVTGLTITGNTVDSNGDAGISVLGAKGPGANLIDNNTVRDNGRFGIEVKASTGTGNDSGAGSLVVSRNIVQRAKGTDARDYAGIAVIRRSGQAQYNDDQPSGAVVKENEVSGFHRAASGSTGDGFGIVVEGLNNVVKNNKVTDNDVGIQVQGGNAANTQNTPGFDRGDAAQGSAAVNNNSITGNDIGLRTVGTITPTPLDAERNWWGSNTGPQPTGSGDSVVSSTPNGVDYDPWLCSGTDTSNATGFQPNPQTSPCTPPTGTITVIKYNDANGNGARDNGEAGLSGWTITVKQGSTTVASGTTDNNGDVSFANLQTGSYTVCETLQSGWTNTDPSDGSGCKTTTVTANSATTVLLGNKAAPQPPVGPAPAQPGKSYAIANGNPDKGKSQFYTITSGNVATPLGPQYSLDFEDVAIQPTTGAIYASVGGDGTNKGYIYRVDGVTGAVTVVGPSGFTKGIMVLKFRASDNTLWGWSEGKGLVQINPATGAGTLVYKKDMKIEGMAWAPNGKLYLARDKYLYEYNQSTGKTVEYAKNLPKGTESLDIKADGTLVGGLYDKKVKTFTYNISTKTVTSGPTDVTTTSPSIQKSIEGLAVPRS